MTNHNYTEESIKSLNWREHIRFRPGMYIGKLSDGSAPDDGIYILVKEIIDNSIDEYTMGFGKTIDIKIDQQKVKIRDYGRGIPLGKVVDCVSKINTGGKYDSSVFQKSVGLNGVGTKAVNALSDYFKLYSFRDKKVKLVEFQKGILIKDHVVKSSTEKNGTYIVFQPDAAIFKNYRFISDFLKEQIWNYVFLNTGLNIVFNGKKYFSTGGLSDLLKRKVNKEIFHYPIIHLKGNDIEIAFTHTSQYSEVYYSFVNGQYTTQGGTHLAAFREGIVKTIRNHFNKNFDTADVRNAILAAVSVKIQEPIFESQTKTKLGSLNIYPNGSTVRSFVIDFLKKKLDDYLHKNLESAKIILKHIIRSEKERKEIAGIKKLATERSKKANLYNKKLRDCRLHFNDKKKDDKKLQTTLFITEGNSASGSITKSRNVETQAVFSLRGKPLNTFSLSKKIVYENEEFNLLQHALNIENSIEDLRYNKIVIATDADIDGMHIRLLILTFFLRFFPELVRKGHLYILETPLFRVRNKKQTHYCYSKEEKEQIIKFKSQWEITRFKGLGEISPNEFGNFIGKNMKLEQVILKQETAISDLLSYYMGKNSTDRQQFIIHNLRTEKELTPL